MRQKQTINCRLCRHYYITWEAKNPHGCRAMGFKSRILPSYHVFQNSGMPCTLYSQKKGRKQ